MLEHKLGYHSLNLTFYCQHPIKPVFILFPRSIKDELILQDVPLWHRLILFYLPLSQYVDFFIKPFVQLLPSYIRDSSDFINTISELNGLPWTFCIINFGHNKSLYTRERLLDIICVTWWCHPTFDVLDRDGFVCLEVAYKYFNLYKDYFLQISGTAMGSIFSPNDANLFMGYFEHRYVFDAQKNPFCSRIMV